MSFPDRWFQQIRKIVGKDNCSQLKEDLVCYSYDATSRSFMPDALVFPGNSNEISSILKLANKENFFVIPRGAGTGMTGGSLPVNGGVVLALKRLNRIIEIDSDNMIARVEPGVVTGDFHKAVEKIGLFYPPDPASSAFSTLGGNLAECSGGPRAVKYGVTRDYVLGLEAVLPTGEIIHTGVSTAKGVVGYDLTRLLVGSEGTLGIITSMIIKLLPLPEQIKTHTAVFEKMEDAAKTVSEIVKSGVIPRAVEYIDKAAIECIEIHLHSDLHKKAGAILILELDGREGEVDKDSIKLKEICLAKGAEVFISAKTEEERTELWKARKAISSALYRFGPDKINEDIVVPRSRIPDMVRKIMSLKEQTGLTMASFGHAGDGNIHVNIMLDKKDKEQLGKALKAVDDLFDYTLELGGTISGEHGIGITKAAYLSKELGPLEIELMKKIKKVFDPNGIMNPGKIFPSI